MTAFRSEFLNIMKERGFLHQCTNLEGLDDVLCKETVTAYCGVDPTGDSLHVGHMIPYLMMRWFQKCGHKPIVLIGGVTGLIADPTGKDESRQLLSEETVQENVRSIADFFQGFIDFEGNKAQAGKNTPPATLVNNADWLRNINYIDFLRDYGKHFSINRMLAMESVKQRLDREQSLSFLEFNYMILQGYDFLELYRKQGCRLQMSGADQWGNVIQGVELGRRVEGVELFGLTAPLLLTASGKKMGKTEAGAVWLNPEKLPSYDYYQYWRNTADADVGRFLRQFTELPIAEIEKLEALKGSELNEAKKILAFEATKVCRGEKAALEAAETARKTFEGGDLASAPHVHLTVTAGQQEVTVLQLVAATNALSSNGEIRRKIQEGAVRIDGQKVDNPLGTVSVANGTVTVSVGKKHHFAVVLSVAS